jgi:putative peptide zinc metalloprotease protein
MNPMAIRVPLVDPGAFLDRHAALWQLLWSGRGLLLWLVLVLPAALLVPAHWPELTGNLADRMFAPDNLLLAALVFPLLKAMHEMGHATAVRAFGGEVHDMGVMLLVMMPVPYVDASASSVLASRWRRAAVGAAGMMVEVFLAALAFYLWLAVEAGTVRAVCFNVMLVCGVSTLVFNGNPLLRYDAYYILCDLAGLPNLAQRAARYWGYLIQRHLLRVRDAEDPTERISEAVWLAAYGLLSSVYRVFVTMAIALFIATRYFFVGVALAIWAVGAMVGLPLLRALRQLQVQPALRERRARIVAGGLAVLAVFAAFAVLVPLPDRSQAEGVVWLPEQATVRGGEGGFVHTLAARPGTRVSAGTLLVHAVDPVLQSQLALAAARVDELRASFANEFAADRARAEIVREQWLQAEAALARARERTAALDVAAGTDGVFTVAAPENLPGRWVKKGEVIGHVIGDDAPVVRVLVDQAQADRVAAATRAVQLRLADEMDRPLGGRIVRQVPAGTDEAPSRALLTSGGGRLPPDPRDPQGRKTLERVFEIEVAPLQPLGRAAAWGQRVYLRFEHAPSPLAVQGWHALRRLFLRHFEV